MRSLPRALPFQKCSGLSVHRGRSDYDFHFSIDVTLCGTGRIWPVSILRTESISGGKLPSGPNALPPHDFAPHTTLADAPRNLATRVLNASTESAQGQSLHTRVPLALAARARPIMPPSVGRGRRRSGQGTSERRRTRGAPLPPNRPPTMLPPTHSSEPPPPHTQRTAPHCPGTGAYMLTAHCPRPRISLPRSCRVHAHLPPPLTPPTHPPRCPCPLEPSALPQRPTGRTAAVSARRIARRGS